MTNQESDSSHHLPNFGVGYVLSAIFSTFLRCYFRLFFMGALILLPLQIINYLFLVNGFNINKVNLNLAEPIVLSAAVSISILVVKDFTHGLPIRLGFYLRTTFECLIPTLLLGTVSVVLSVVGLLLFIIPGLCISAMWSVLVPVILIERAGFQSLTRSANLTRNYIWPIVGVMSVTSFICLLVFDFYITMRALGILYITELNPPYLMIILYFLDMFSDVSLIAFFSVVVVILYERLRELKENASLESVSDVFD